MTETTARRTVTTAVHLVPHTHWDREWYEPFQTFRMRLVELVDRLLEMLEDPRFAFTLDGQLATVDDYLEVRPGAEARIRELVREGRLAIGPWLVLMDEFHVSGENMARNLELGWRRAEELGRAMPVGYLPDMFGHVAQMPQMLRRAGIADAVVWRGVPAAVERHAFRWRSPDGSEVRTEYLVGGYGQAAYLFAIPERLSGKVADYHDLMRSWYGDESVLAMYGTDHATPLPGLVDLVEGVNAAQDRYRMRITTLAEYIATRPQDASLTTWVGEMRSGARANVLMGVTSNHIDVRQAAGRAERLVERYAEPLQALHGDVWPDELLRICWRRLVENSAHDSICACSVDPVVAQVLTRFAEAEQIARGLVQRVAANVAAHVGRDAWVALNPSPTARTGLIEIGTPIPAEWPSVALETDSGERLATQEVRRTQPLVHEVVMAADEVPVWLHRRLHGREIFGRLVNAHRIEGGPGPTDERTITLDVDIEADPPSLDIDQVRQEIVVASSAVPDAPWRMRVISRPRRTLEAMVDLPALGWAAFRPVEGTAQPDQPVVIAARSLSNGLLAVEALHDGSLRIEGGGATLEGVGRIVDGGDFGDSYNYGRPPDDLLVDRPRSVECWPGAPGPLRGELVIRRTYDWPVGIQPDGQARAAETRNVALVTRVELRVGEPFVRIAVSFDNPSSDHRVRYHIPLARPASGTAAEGQFAVVERGTTLEGGHGEVPLPTFPARGFVDAGGVAVLLDHVTEYELLEGRELAITLLRSIGVISRNDNPFREDPAGPERPMPSAQLHGPRTFTFALFPHRGTWVDADVLAAAERYQHGFVVAPGTAAMEAPARSASRASGLELDGRGVVMTALRRRDGWLELRVVAEHPAPTRAVLRGDIVEARTADLLGRPGEPLELEGGVLTLELGAWEIRTVQLRRPSAA